MKHPRTSGIGITGAQKSLGGDSAHDTHVGSITQRCSSTAPCFDREADACLNLGKRLLAEHLSRRAADLRTDVVA
jgi:hypothetical protein